MFYGAFVLAKKGPLAKVWLAAHWDKKLTKAHVFETDVESTVNSIISPQVKLALRTSGHLLLGVVRIYSRKQKYLIHDLGEACAKIKMAFRPNIVDLPSGGGAGSADAVTLPEIFHDFEDAFTADLGVLDHVEAQFTIKPGRTSEITMPEDVTTTTGTGDLFGGEFDGFGGDFSGGSIEEDRVGGSVTTKSHISDDGGVTGRDEKFEDAVHDFGDDDGGFGFINFGKMPDDLTHNHEEEIKEAEKDDTKTGDDTKTADGRDEEISFMEVDPPLPPDPPRSTTPEEQPPEGGDQSGVQDIPVPPAEEEGFSLDPVEVIRVEEKRAKRKRRLVVDNVKEFTGQQIKAQFEDYKDLLQPKCFPPPTKKAMMWKEMASCDYLFSNPATPGLPSTLGKLITRGYTNDIPGQVAPETTVELENIDINTASVGGEVTEVERVSPDATTAGMDISAKDGDKTAEQSTTAEQSDSVAGLREGDPTGPNLEIGPGDYEFDNVHGVLPDEEREDISGATVRVIPGFESFNATESTEDHESSEFSEGFEQRRWTNRTKQVLQVLQPNLAANKVMFSSLTLKCNRKQAASRFYTILLLAKEGMITVNQPEPYADITLTKGPKFQEAF